MIEQPETGAMAALPTQDYVTGSGAASERDETQPGTLSSENAIMEETEALKRELSILSTLNKSTSYVDSVLDSSNICSTVPELVPQTDVPAMMKQSTMDANEILPLMPVTKSFCARYLDQLNKKSPSTGPRTPTESPQVSLLSRNSSSGLQRSGLMTPPVGSFCPLVSGPLASSQSFGSEAAAPALVTYRSVNSPLNLSTTDPEVTENPVTAPALVSDTSINSLNTPEEAGKDEEAMETEDGEKEESKEAASGVDMDTSLVTPPPPMLSPVRSLPAAENLAAPAPAPAAAPAGVFSHPGGPAPVQIAFSFDTTGSMSQCIDEVRAQLRDIIQRLLGDVPHLQIAVIAHGDYCDATEFYMIKSVDFTNDVNALTTFVNDVSGTGGGDYDECYEYVLNYARNKLTWSPWTQRSLVMIGDATPHAPDYNLNTLNLDWRQEAFQLYQKGVHIYAVQCKQSSNPIATPFWQGLADKTEGKHIAMEDFSSIVDLMLAICYKETGPEFFDAYEREVRFREARAGLNKDLVGMFATLRSDSTASSSSLAPTPAPIPTVTPAAARARGPTRKVTAKKLAGARKKPYTAAAKKAAGKAKMSKMCSCILCDGKTRADKSSTSRTAGCSCVMCWTPGSSKPTSLKKNCSCVMCDGTKNCTCIMCGTSTSVKNTPKKDCSCIMCGGVSKPKRILAKGTKKRAAKSGTTPNKQKKPRESVPEGRFAFRNFRWSAWKVAMVPNIPGNTGLLKNWEPCTRSTGFMRTDLFKAVLRKPAVYEVAVQPSRGCKNYVVHCKASKGTVRSWSSHILPGYIWSTVDKALTDNCKIFVRSAPIAPQRKTVKIGADSFKLTSPLQVKNHMVRTYDYAWQKRRIEDGSTGTRLVTRGGVTMSG